MRRRPRQRSARSTPRGLARKVALSGDLAFLADGPEGLRIIDVSNPAAPVEIGSLDTPVDAFDVSVHGSLAAVADDTGGVHLIDVSVPSAPFLVQTIPTSPMARTVLLARHVLYFGGDGAQKLSVVDVTDPANPILLGSPTPFESPLFESSTSDLVVVDDILYAASSESQALRLFPVQCAIATAAPGEIEIAQPRGLRIVPNPVPAYGARLVFAAPASAPAKLTIHDVAGRRIRTLAAPAASASNERVAFWEGRDEAGRAVAPGVYFVRLERAGQDAEVQKLTLVR